MKTAAALANKAFSSARADHAEAAYYVKGASYRARKTAKKEATRALRATKRAHIADCSY